jgi:hypothetical protein
LIFIGHCLKRKKTLNSHPRERKCEHEKEQHFRFCDHGFEVRAMIPFE